LVSSKVFAYLFSSDFWHRASLQYLMYSADIECLYYSKAYIMHILPINSTNVVLLFYPYLMFDAFHHIF